MVSVNHVVKIAVGTIFEEETIVRRTHMGPVKEPDDPFGWPQDVFQNGDFQWFVPVFTADHVDFDFHLLIDEVFAVSFAFYKVTSTLSAFAYLFDVLKFSHAT